MKILAIGAHPDDVEILCGGTLAIYARRGDDVAICHFCTGDKGGDISNTSSEKLAKIRRREAIEAANLIGAKSMCGGIPDDEAVVDFKSRMKMVDIIRQVNPDVVFTHPPDDYLSDHTNVSRLVFEAIGIASSSMSKTNYPCTSTIPVLYYMDTVAGINFNPLEYVDISETLDIKIKMVLKMNSQLDWLKETYKYDLMDIIKTTAKFRGFQANVFLAEAFAKHQMFSTGIARRVLP